MTTLPTLSASTITACLVAISARLDELNATIDLISAAPVETRPDAIDLEAWLIEQRDAYTRARGELFDLDRAQIAAIGH